MSEEDHYHSRESTPKVILNGSDNYSHWYRNTTALLLGKSLIPYIPAISDLSPLSVLTSAAERKSHEKANEAYSIVLRSLSEVCQQALPFETVDPINPKPVALWKAIVAKYSASNGARTAALFEEIWTGKVEIGVDPTSAVALVRSQYSQIITGGITHEKAMAFAMLNKVPEDWGTFKMNLWMKKDLSPEDVMEAVQAEALRRRAEDGRKGEALRASAAAAAAFVKPSQKDARKQYPRDPSKYCTKHQCSGHSTEECFGVNRNWICPAVRSKVTQGKEGEGRVATATVREESKNIHREVQRWHGCIFHH